MEKFGKEIVLTYVYQFANCSKCKAIRETHYHDNIYKFSLLLKIIRNNSRLKILATISDHRKAYWTRVVSERFSNNKLNISLTCKLFCD